MRQLLNPDGRACGEELGGVAEWEAIIRIYYMEKLFPVKGKKHVLKQPESKTRTTKPYNSQLFRKCNFKCHKPEVEVTVVQILRFNH